jgi:hypothetical protein
MDGSPLFFPANSFASRITRLQADVRAAFAANSQPSGPQLPLIRGYEAKRNGAKEKSKK